MSQTTNFFEDGSVSVEFGINGEYVNSIRGTWKRDGETVTVVLGETTHVLKIESLTDDEFVYTTDGGDAITCKRGTYGKKRATQSGN